MKSADKLRAGSTFEDKGVPFLILKALEMIKLVSAFK